MKDILKDAFGETVQLKIENNLPKDDYKEFLELIIIILEGVPATTGYTYVLKHLALIIFHVGWQKRCIV